MAEKRYLMTPGPTPAPPEVLAAMAQPVVHHRGPDYKKLYAECLGRLREIFRTESEVLLFGGSGTGAMESAVANLVRPGELALVASCGKFGERWAEMCDAYGAATTHLEFEWGEKVDPDQVGEALAKLGRPTTLCSRLTRSRVSAPSICPRTSGGWTL